MRYSFDGVRYDDKDDKDVYGFTENLQEERRIFFWKVLIIRWTFSLSSGKMRF